MDSRFFMGYSHNGFFFFIPEKEKHYNASFFYEYRLNITLSILILWTIFVYKKYVSTTAVLGSNRLNTLLFFSWALVIFVVSFSVGIVAAIFLRTGM
jgi:hypothetical protein